MPTAVSGGAAPEIRSTETEFMESIERGAVAIPSPDHRATVREARTKAADAFHTPASSKPIPHKLSTTGAALIGSSTARGSSSRNEGTANRSVTPAATTNGARRSAKSKSAQRLAEYYWPAKPHPPPDAANRDRQGAVDYDEYRESNRDPAHREHYSFSLCPNSALTQFSLAQFPLIQFAALAFYQFPQIV